MIYIHMITIPQISRFLYIGPRVKYRPKFSFSSKKSYKYHNFTGFLTYKSR